MKLEFIDIDNLKLSPLNVRKHGHKNGDDLIPSIKSLGVLQPLLVRPNCEGFEIIAGQRRFHALNVIAQQEDVEPVPCIIMDEGDDAAAIEASLAENIARLPMDEIDQYVAFSALLKQGRSVEDIAAHFGVTERLVTQRLAIANLYVPILNAYRRDEIEPSTIRILTMATTRQQKAWFKLFKSEDEYAPEGYQLRSWLFGGDEIPVENALFDLNGYDGVITTDLFGEESYFSDSTQFWEHQSRAIAGMIADYKAEGWSEVELLDVGERWCKWEHGEIAKDEGGKVYIVCSSDGEVTAHEGFLPEKEIKHREQAAHSGVDKPNDRPELTKSMQNYLGLHRHAAVRTELLAHSGIALRLAVAQIIAGSAQLQAHADPQKANADTIKQSLKGNTAEDLFAQERLAVCGLLELCDSDRSSVVPKKEDWNADRDVHAIFARLLELDDETASRILTFVIAETLPCGSAIVEILGNLISVDMANHWKPDEVFFDLLWDKEGINAMVYEVAGKNAAEENIAATAKVQKSIVQNCLSGERKAEVQNWQPRYMRFPMEGYTERGGIDAIEAWNGVKDTFEAA